MAEGIRHEAETALSRQNAAKEPGRENRLLQIVHSAPADPAAPADRPRTAGIRQSSTRRTKKRITTPPDSVRTGLFGQAGTHSHPAAPEQADTAGLLPDTLTDRGSAKLFASLHSNRFRHVPGLGWYQWSGSRWQLDENECVLWAAGEMAESLALSDPSGAHTAAALRLHRRRALSTSGIRAMLVQARSAPGMVLSAGVLDADPYVLCTPAGVVDL
ncbi:hypothetical protein ACWFRX_40540, partial [Streptomyces sp. NPDC055100]